MATKTKGLVNGNGIGSDLVPLNNAYWVPLDQIEPNPFQPREYFDPEEMQQLADNIKKHGVQQPILLRPITGKSHKGVRYQLVAGERRWRASQQAGKVQIPAIVREISDIEARELAYDENVQRESLTDYEEARGLKELWKAYEQNGETVSQNQMARRRNVSVTFVSNRVKLLALDDDLLQFAKKERGVMSSLFLIGSVSNAELKDQLKEMLRAGASFRKIETTKAQWESNEAQRRASYRAPDSETQTRLNLHEKSGGGQMSRGRILTSVSSRDAGEEVDQAVAEIEGRLRHIVAWWEALTPAQQQKHSRRLEKVRRQIDSIGVVD